MKEILTAEKLAGMIDHTSLKATASSADIEKLCNEAEKYGFYSVCVNPAYVSYTKDRLEKSKVKICSVVGFPLGMNSNYTKKREASDCLADGADELDMVINVARLKEKDYKYVLDEIKGVVKEALLFGNAPKNTVKIIIETCYLTPEEIVEATKIVAASGADYIKTSTGFGTPASGPSGATVENVRLMKETIDSLKREAKIITDRTISLANSDNVAKAKSAFNLLKTDLKIKAAGGISNLETALAMINAGASRLGCSKSVDIFNELVAEAALSA